MGLPAPTLDLEHLPSFLASQGVRAKPLHWLTPDASTRRFLRVSGPGGETRVAMLYPEGAESQVAHHARVFLWARGQSLPVPRLYLWSARLLLVEDLGNLSLREYLQGNANGGELVLQALRRLQGASLSSPNPPFSARLFLQELQQFLDQCPLTPDQRKPAEAFCWHLSQALEGHPFRLCHRDFHLDNLLFHEGQVKFVDFQDLRAGPDTYDLVSLLRERGGTRLFPSTFAQEAARQLRLEKGWEDRFWQCAAQRGLKALGTFLRLHNLGRPHYLSLVPEVAANTKAALERLNAPPSLVGLVASLACAYNA
jgi:aminoglycoside/choline kinase family phosphotransferase